jgi:hypothetical protein
MTPTTINRIISGVLALGFVAAGIYLVTLGESVEGGLLIGAGITTAALPRVNEKP